MHVGDTRIKRINSRTRPSRVAALFSQEDTHRMDSRRPTVVQDGAATAHNATLKLCSYNVPRQEDEGAGRVNPTCTSCHHSGRVKSTFFLQRPQKPALLRSRETRRNGSGRNGQAGGQWRRRGGEGGGEEAGRRTRQRRIKEVKETAERVERGTGKGRATGGAESNRAKLSFRSDRAVKTNRRAHSVADS